MHDRSSAPSAGGPLHPGERPQPLISRSEPNRREEKRSKGGALEALVLARPRVMATREREALILAGRPSTGLPDIRSGRQLSERADCQVRVQRAHEVSGAVSLTAKRGQDGEVAAALCAHAPEAEGSVGLARESYPRPPSVPHHGSHCKSRAIVTVCLPSAEGEHAPAFLGQPRRFKAPMGGWTTLSRVAYSVPIEITVIEGLDAQQPDGDSSSCERRELEGYRVQREFGSKCQVPRWELSGLCATLMLTHAVESQDGGFSLGKVGNGCDA
ncbi:hypothetical protein CONPUDRAFT_163822 [Coniophora puteana RWD-64-598 SS2]|uniref:Uncharacterized protein n=1 Tax=Coniophora puteana (strain RWD-64-598) TaxID=741705 RepID=A0A5M3MUF4_CONPW|nr:uncharacterized protein CONPUDRAFT_163822 [Coniophora puteana RWD-64-598 SS2]EIW82743.1 hypothetical protein CONPUDRAFT_163822 [Coniophora puteana RWD-64-598 SS2]